VTPREEQRSNAEALVQLRNSKAGRKLKKLMKTREMELRLAHYASDDPCNLATVSENKGAYSELQFWYTMIFRSSLNVQPEE